jgi:hypothetical protein
MIPLRSLTFALSVLLCSGNYGQAPSTPPDPSADVAAKMAAAQKRLIQVSSSAYTLGEVQINATSREIRFPCVILHQQLPIEYLLVHETGKDHETILTTAVSPTDLQVAMLLAHYTPGTTGLFALLPKDEPPPFAETAPATPDGHRVTLSAEWKDSDGKTQTAPLSQWFQNSDTRLPPEIDFWIFNGSKIDERGFIAESEGSFISVYADANALFNSPAAGNHRDDLWISLPKNIPPETTAVTLIISPFQPKPPPTKPNAEP